MQSNFKQEVQLFGQAAGAEMLQAHKAAVGAHWFKKKKKRKTRISLEKRAEIMVKSK